ncbi:CHC2 zinc finger domain-containing protein [Tolypothrix sp. VBCCA 56010]|uniref:CHC2 zinc finger domain-containing protein n=1 Tax=Tolypothrix sp. VBCCA 56010 TaxID=3137731 RepID=UPI003D7E839F
MVFSFAVNPSPQTLNSPKPAFNYQAFLDEAYSQLTVDQVYTHISHQFKQSGEKYRGGCPFHESKSGSSFVVNENSLLFYCAGCQSGGSALDYLHSIKAGRWEKARGKDFIEAAKQLAELAGIPFPSVEKSPEEIERARRWESRREILQVVTEYGKEVLWSSRGIDARNYLIKERGFTEEQIKDLNLGLHLSRKELEKVLLSKGCKLDDIKNAGVLWSKLEGYILFPWNDSQSRPLTIYGRYPSKVIPEGKDKTIALKGEGTKQSPLYFDRALQAGHKEIILVEGVIDAALLQVKGDTRVCACVAASCSEAQIKTLVKRGIKSVTLCGDPDTGGDNGTVSNINRIMATGIDVFVAPKLPDRLDPDEFVIKFGMSGWEKHINDASHAFTYLANCILAKHDITNDYGKLAAINEAFAFNEKFTQPQHKVSLQAFFWKEICQRLEIDKEELFGDFKANNSNSNESSSDGDSQENSETEGTEAEWRSQRERWKTPTSHEGEVGFWKKEKAGDDGEDKYFFEPACNFDFQIEREIEDADGGGLVLQVKRSFEKNQIRVILNSTDYTKADTFTDALKRALGTGIVCNLTKPQLNALIHTRLHEYRTTRKGKVFKRIDRYGQQADGTWVFRDRQFKKDGTPTNENKSGWVFNPSLGKEDFIPCPELAEQNPQALKTLVDASRKFFGDRNINQVLLMMGWVVAGLNFQEIFSQNKSFPLSNSFGEPGSCKTLAAEAALSLVGVNWARDGMLARVSVSAIYEHGARTGSLPFIWDDPARTPENEELAKNWYNCKSRRVRGNEQTPHSAMGIVSNHIVGGEQAATYTRFIRTGFERASGGNKVAFQELQEAQKTASGAFSEIIALGYSKNEIATLETELLHYLPHAHARIAQSLAIVTWYAQKIVELTGGNENIKQWVVDNCCKSENDSDASGNSLQDYIDKILALEAESLVGDWNFNRKVERNGQQFYAIYAHDVWKLVDQRFKPATYNERSLKSLVIKAGGITDTTVRFSYDRDQVLTYNRALINARLDSEGCPIPPIPPDTVPRKAWLIPAHLFGETDKVDEPVTERNQPPVTPPQNPVTPQNPYESKGNSISDVTAVTECNRNPVTPSTPDESSTCAPSDGYCNRVTEKNDLKIKKEDEKKVENKPNTGTQINSGCNPNSGYTGYTPSENEKTQENQGFQAVTGEQSPPVTPGYTSYNPLENEKPQENQAFDTVTEDQLQSVTSVTSPAPLDQTLTNDLWAEVSNSEPEAELKKLMALILQCKIWVEFTELPEINQEKIITVVEKASQRHIKYLSRLLSTHLLETNNFKDLIWLPEKLIAPTLSKITFTVRKKNLGSQEIEVIRECKMIGIKNQTQNFWTFSAPGISRMAINNDDDFTSESLISDSPVWG